MRAPARFLPALGGVVMLASGVPSSIVHADEVRLAPSIDRTAPRQHPALAAVTSMTCVAPLV
jgi:hypothetical protein